MNILEKLSVTCVKFISLKTMGRFQFSLVNGLSALERTIETVVPGAYFCICCTEHTLVRFLIHVPRAGGPGGLLSVLTNNIAFVYTDIFHFLCSELLNLTSLSALKTLGSS